MAHICSSPTQRASDGSEIPVVHEHVVSALVSLGTGWVLEEKRKALTRLGEVVA